MNKYTSVEITNWSNNSRTMTCVIPLVGVPFCESTRCTKTFQIKKKTDTQIIIEIDSKTIDAPYSDTFSCKELWIAMCREKGEPMIVMQKLMQVAFVKWTMLKAKIQGAAEAGLVEVAQIWTD